MWYPTFHAGLCVSHGGCPLKASQKIKSVILMVAGFYPLVIECISSPDAAWQTPSQKNHAE